LWRIPIAKTKKPQLIIVEWGDAHAGARWIVEEDMVKRPLVVTWVGFLVSNTKEGLSLAFGLDESGNYAGHMFVPAGMIIKIKKVKY
jgi:hypothetical protein